MDGKISKKKMTAARFYGWKFKKSTIFCVWLACIISATRAPSRFETWGTSWDDAKYMQTVVREECGAGFDKALRHFASEIANRPDRQPLVYDPQLHGLGDRLKGLVMCLRIALFRR